MSNRSCAVDPTTPASSYRRPHRGRRLVLGVAVAAGAALTACSPVNNTPANYDATSEGTTVVRANFLATCTGQIPNASTTTLLARQSVCECMYNVLVDMVPYSKNQRGQGSYATYPDSAPTFQDLDNSLKDDPSKINELPQSVRDALNKCSATGTAGPVAPTGQGTTPTGTTR